MSVDVQSFIRTYLKSQYFPNFTKKKKKCKECHGINIISREQGWKILAMISSTAPG